MGDAAVVVTDPDRPELGRFLRAQVDLPVGTLVFREQPLIRVGRRPVPQTPETLVALRRADLFVSGGPVLRKLQRSCGADSADMAWLQLVLHFNSFAAGRGGQDQVVFGTLSRANHSCSPNCIADGDEGTLRTLRQVAAGEELTVSYLTDAMLLWPGDKRREQLASRWDFQCRCTRCAEAADDVRRFRGCQHGGCPGTNFVAIPGTGGSSATLRCADCGHRMELDQEQELLKSEALATASLERALSGDLEEEEEGQELIRCNRFAVQHPNHWIAIRLSHDYCFPDPVLAKQSVLEGLRSVFASTPCQLAVDTLRELADLLEDRGSSSEALAALKAAAATASILDGLPNSEQVLEDWSKSRRPTSKAVGSPMPPARRSYPDPEDFVREPETRELSRQPATTRMSNPSRQPDGRLSTNREPELRNALDAEMPALQGCQDWRWGAAAIAGALAACVVATMFRTRRSGLGSLG